MKEITWNREKRQKSCQVGNKEKLVKLGEQMMGEYENKIMKVLTENKNMFAWTTTDMLGVDPHITCHKLSVYKEAYVVLSQFVLYLVVDLVVLQFH